MTARATKAKPATRIPSFRLVNGTQLAQIIGVSPGRISNLVHHGLPREDTKLYDLAQVVPWSIQRALEKGDVSGSGSARQQYFEAMAERARLDTEKLKGALYGRDETNQFIAGLVVQLRENILSLPERVTRDRSTAAKLDSEIASFLDDIADAIATWAGDGGAVIRTLESATPARRRRVGGSKQKAPTRKPAARKVQKRKRTVSR